MKPKTLNILGCIMLAVGVTVGIIISATLNVVLGIGCIVAGILIYFDPVSYTHLDVYKRQLLLTP